MRRLRFLLVFILVFTAFMLLSASSGFSYSAPIMRTSNITYLPSSPDLTLVGWCSATDNDGDYLRYSWKWFLDGNLHSMGEERAGIWCYQETANISTKCGGLGAGRYSFGGITNLINGTRIYDGSWSSYGFTSAQRGSGQSYMYVNYSKPANATPSSKWQVKDGNATINLTLPAACWNRNVLMLRATSGLDYIRTLDGNYITAQVISEYEDYYYSDWACYNGAGWTSLRTTRSILSPVHRIYDEAMWWEISSAHASGMLVNVSSISSGIGPGQKWRLECTAYDGTYYSAALLSPEITIMGEEGNTAPVMETSLITSTPEGYRDNGILLGWCGADDYDGDSLTYSWQWFLNDEPFSKWFINDGSSTPVEEIKDGWCYQETANLSTSCGGLGAGRYSGVGHVNFVNGQNAYDGNWASYGFTNAQMGMGQSFMYVNYTKPAKAAQTSRWQVKDGNALINLTIPTNCWSQNELMLRATSGVSSLEYTDESGVYHADGSYYYAKWECYDGKAWTSLRTIRSSTSYVYWIYEEAMWWDLSRELAPGKPVNVDRIASGLKPGQRWRLECSAYDGIDYSDVLSSQEITIVGAGQNTAPEITDISITPAQPGIGDDLSCYVTARDLENQTLEMEYTWYRGNTAAFSGTAGVISGQNSLISTLGKGNLSVGDVWNCTVRAYDGQYYSGYSSRAVTILSSLPPGWPRTLDVAIYPESPDDNMDLYCNATIIGGSNELTAYWYWYRDGVLHSRGNKTGVESGVNTLITNVSKLSTSPNQVWNCTIYFTDGMTIYPEMLSDSVVINEVIPRYNPPPGGGGGSSGYWIRTYTTHSWEEGYTQLLGVRERVTIQLGTNEYYVGVVGLDATSATINVSTDPVQQRRIWIGESEDFELTGDSNNDLRVKLDKIEAAKASIIISRISQSAAPPVGPAQPPYTQPTPRVDSDQDLDGIDDSWEDRYCGGDCDPNADLDNDGLTNIEEFRNWTDPNNKDTDGDGWTDKSELDSLTDPLNPDSRPEEDNEFSAKYAWMPAWLRSYIWWIVAFFILLMIVILILVILATHKSHSSHKEEKISELPPLQSMDFGLANNNEPLPVDTQAKEPNGIMAGSNVIPDAGVMIDYETGIEVPIPLIEYIDRVESMGFSDPQIRAVLLNVGWTDRQIEAGLRILRK